MFGSGPKDPGSNPGRAILKFKIEEMKLWKTLKARIVAGALYKGGSIDYDLSEASKLLVDYYYQGIRNEKELIEAIK